MFSNSGPCGIPQGTNTVRLFRGTQVSQPNLLYVCSNRNNSPCPETYTTSTIRAVNSGGHKFNLTLTLPNAALEDGRTYTAEVEVQRPSGGLTTLRNTFHVTVSSPPTIPPSPTTPPPTIPSGTHTSYCVRIVLSSYFGLPQHGRKGLVDTLTFQIFLYIETDLISLMMQFGQKIFNGKEHFLHPGNFGK